MKRRLVIIGAGSSGLICLKNAIEALPDWEIICLEKSGSIRGCWGNPYPGFVSTSTKYTTQFACFAKYDAGVDPDGGAGRAEFFCDGEYGDYLEAFADEFDLRGSIRLGCEVHDLAREDVNSKWQLSWTHGTERFTETFDAVVLATGLAAESKSIESPIPTLPSTQFQSAEGIASVQNERIVVFGGGESAVDAARRLADPALNNQVFLSLRSGIRVSPRYHPIHGVPSDFLRNRLMLSIHPDLRNWIGKRFVAARMRHKKLFEKLFPPAMKKEAPSDVAIEVKRRDWAMRLTDAAKGDLFDMFHNKSDDFLDFVARGKITIVGVPDDESFNTYRPFGHPQGNCDLAIEVNPDRIVPAIGYRSAIDRITNDQVNSEDFYLGCIHVKYSDLFLVGFARPVIGNIPTISEMQARYICGLLAGEWSRPDSIETRHQNEQIELTRRFSSVDRRAVYPVEMFPYCDELARQMNAYPSLRSIGNLWQWFRIRLTPATTLHYVLARRTIGNVGQRRHRSSIDPSPIYLPTPLTILLLCLKPIDIAYRLFKSCQAAIQTRRVTLNEVSINAN